MLKFLFTILVVFVFEFTAKAQNPGVVQIEDPSSYKQVLALSDVHGMYDPLKSLLTANSVVDSDSKWSAGKTLLIVLGDSIDKGDHSVEVMEFWIRLTIQAEAAGGRVVHVLGNHEAELLAYGKENGKSKELFRELKRRGLKKKSFIAAESSWGKFLRSMPLAAKVGRWLFCHSGFYPELKWNDFVSKASDVLQNGRYTDAFLLGEFSILEAKDWWIDQTRRQKLLERMTENGIWGIVQGHQPKAYGIKHKIGGIEDGRFIKVDNGMAPEGGENPGSLLRFAEPVQMKLHKQPKLEVLTSKGKIKEFSLYHVDEN